MILNKMTKKTLHWLLILMMGAMMSVALPACGGGDDDDSPITNTRDQNLVGSWEWTDTDDEMTLVVVFTFDNKGKFECVNSVYYLDDLLMSASYGGRWSTANGKLTLEVTHSDADDTLVGEVETIDYRITDRRYLNLDGEILVKK